MRRAWLARLSMVLIFAALLIGIATLFRQPRVEVSQAPPQSEEGMSGDQVELRVFDTSGNPKDVVKARKGRQLEGDAWQLLDLEATFQTEEGRLIRFSADHFEERDGRRKLSSNPGSRILIQEEKGLHMQTEGPLTMEPSGFMTTQSQTKFSLTKSSGEAQVLSYWPGERLELDQGANLKLGNGATFDGDHIALDLQKHVGFLDRGRYRQSLQGQSTFLADAMVFPFYSLDGQFHLETIFMYGNPTRLSWEDGQFSSDELRMCMDREGIHVLDSKGPSKFSYLSSDLSNLSGNSGAMELTLFDDGPQSFHADGPIQMIGQNEGQTFEIRAIKGLETSFENGVAAETSLHGQPQFEFGVITGKAGHLRLLHKENRMLLSQNGELVHRTEDFFLQGEEILVTNWVGGSREFFARGFVNLESQHLEGGMVAKGDQIRMVFPERWLFLEGQPAEFHFQDSEIKANQVRIFPTGPQNYLLVSEGEIENEIMLDNQDSVFRAESMRIDTAASTIHLNRVLEGSFGPLESLQARSIQIAMNPQNEVETFLAEGQVSFRGQMQGQDPKRYSGRSEMIRYEHASQELVLASEKEDVILLFEDHNEFRGKSLTYNLADGSMRADSGPFNFGTTVIVVPRKQQND